MVSRNGYIRRPPEYLPDYRNRYYGNKSAIEGAPKQGAPGEGALRFVGGPQTARARLARLDLTNRWSDIGFTAFTERGSLSLEWKSSKEEQSHTAQNRRQMGLWC